MEEWLPIRWFFGEQANAKSLDPMMVFGPGEVITPEAATTRKSDWEGTAAPRRDVDAFLFWTFLGADDDDDIFPEL